MRMYLGVSNLRAKADSKEILRALLRDVRGDIIIKKHSCVVERAPRGIHNNYQKPIPNHERYKKNMQRVVRKLSFSFLGIL